MQVLNEANLTNAVLVRSVLTRSDLGGAVIEGADFSDAVLDLPQKQVSLYVSSIANVLIMTNISTRLTREIKCVVFVFVFVLFCRRCASTLAAPIL